MTWLSSVGQYILIVILFFGGLRLLAMIGQMSENLLNVQRLLSENNEQQKQMRGKLHAIEAHTRRSAKPLYDQDEWEDRQPPL